MNTNKIEPYYDHEGITIYNCDCLKLLQQMNDDDFDLVLTDPPYGIGADKAASKNKGKNGWKFYGETDWDSKRPEKEVFDNIRRVSKSQIIWGGNYFADMLPASMGWITWDKGQRNFSLADGELAWTSFNKALRIFDYARVMALKDVKRHPTQKALDLMLFCIRYADDPKTILDPFMGSGTTLRAAKDQGLRAVGIEVNRKYCDIAIDRMAQGVLNFE